MVEVEEGPQGKAHLEPYRRHRLDRLLRPSIPVLQRRLLLRPRREVAVTESEENVTPGSWLDQSTRRPPGPTRHGRADGRYEGPRTQSG